MSLPLTARKSLRDSEPTLQANLKKVDDATGIAGWTFQPDLAGFYAALPNVSSNAQDTLGVQLYDFVLGGLTGNIVELVKDDMCKEAFLEQVPTRVIKLAVAPATTDKFNTGTCSFADGALVLTVHPKEPTSNARSLGKDIEKLL